MRRERSSRTLLALSLLVAGVAGGLLGARPWAGGDPATVRAQDASNAMAVDADPATAAVDASITRAVGAKFDVSVNITAALTPYQGYKGFLQWDNAIVDDASPPVYTYTGLGGMTLDSTPTEKPSGLQFGSVRVSDTSNDTGTAFAVELTCLAAGTGTLHLVTPAEDPAFGNTHLAPGGSAIDTTLTDAQVTCGEGGPPPPGASPTPGGPAPTATPLPPGMEAVDLVAGCNPVASTYPDATPTQTIASNVGRTGILTSVWKFQAGTWLGYSPQFPEVSDLTETEFLDALFICVNNPGAFVRPIV